MILADKIIYLRKKAGWSQEELAEKMEVSRQSISKWEGALSVPDMNRILKLSELFDVSTDYLLRDEMEEEEKNPAADARRSLFPALLACFYVLCLRYFCFFFPAPEKRDCFR